MVSCGINTNAVNSARKLMSVLGEVSGGMKDGELWYKDKRVAEDSKIWAARCTADAVCMHRSHRSQGHRDLVVMVRHTHSQ